MTHSRSESVPAGAHGDRHPPVSPAAAPADEGRPASGLSPAEALSVELSPQCEMMRAVYILCHMMMRVMDRAVQPHGLTGSRWHLLIVIRDMGGPLTITQLSECLFLSPQNVSRMVASLEADGLVTRDPTGPGRTVRVALTGLGAERVAACEVLCDACGDRMLGDITEAELRQATAVLERTILNTVALERSLAERATNGPATNRGPTRPPQEIEA